ncbi:MAG: glycosyl transferase family 1 [Thermoplasmata archaeon]|nr:MAG: glycosyl transferase family 1 [Thermoplasmata archaeon]
MVKEKNKKPTILYLYKHDRSFVKRDLDMLMKHFNVIPFRFSFRKIFRLFTLMPKSDVVFVWFASYHAFIATIFAKLFSKKLVIVTGGYDVAGEKEINYGLMINPFTRRMVKFILKNADKILAVSEFNRREIEKYVNVQNVEVIYNSVDHDKFFPSGKKEKMVLTVGFITWENIKRKGLETFVRSAKYLPDVKFVLVGAFKDSSIDFLKSISTSNVEFVGYVSDEELIKYYQKAKVYCQLSYYESFGMAPAEAMLCECIPVVTARGALPEVVGNTGFYVPYGDEKATAEAIKRALDVVSEIGKKARERIIRLFSHRVREKRLVEMVKNLKDGNENLIHP